MEVAKLNPVRVLIIDDDVDSALLVESVFSQLGCATVCSLTPAETKKQMCSKKADIIILDWMLGQDTEAPKVVADCESIFDKFAEEERSGGSVRSRLVTYSTLNEVEIRPLSNRYFEHLGHWAKSMDRRGLLDQALDLLHQLGR